MTPTDLYGPWEVEGYQVEIDITARARLAASRDGNRLKALPQAVRDSGEMAWLRLSLQAVQSHQRELRTLLETAMVEDISLPAEDLAALALDPVGRTMLSGLLFEIGGATGRPLPEGWLLETLEGDLLPLGAPARVVHPATLQQRGTLERWNGWLNRCWFPQPFKQIRRELYVPKAEDQETQFYSSRYAGDCVRWDQARALLEGRGWYRVTKASAERRFRSTRLTAYLDFRTPATRGFSREQVLLGRIYFLPIGEQVTNHARPGIELDRVPPVVFSETLRDVALAASVAGR